MSTRLKDMPRIEKVRERIEENRNAKAVEAKALLETQEWGIGDQADAKPWGYAQLNGKRVELVWGQYPHSRRDDQVYARFEDGTIEPFSGHQTQVKVSIETQNYLKESGLSGNEIRKSGTANIYFDGDLAYSFGFREPEQALREAADLINKLHEHGSNIYFANGRVALIGKKVWYDNTPAVVTRWFPDQGSVVLQAEGTHRFPQPAWWGEDSAPWEWEQELKADLLSEHIHWYREEKKSD